MARSLCHVRGPIAAAAQGQLDQIFADKLAQKVSFAFLGNSLDASREPLQPLSYPNQKGQGPEKMPGFDYFIDRLTEPWP